MKAILPLQMLEFHGGAVDGKAVAAAWLGALPLTADELEAAVAHEQLVRLVEASDPRWAACPVLHCVCCSSQPCAPGAQVQEKPGVLRGRRPLPHNRMQRPADALARGSLAA